LSKDTRIVHRPLRIAVVEEDSIRAAILLDGLRDAGIADVEVIDTMTHMLRRLGSIDPDVIIIGIESPSRELLTQVLQVSGLVSCPVAMFVDHSDESMIHAAVEAGVSAYVVDGLRRERVKAVVDMAVSRFNAFERLRRELEAARSELASRKVVERAKGILMKSRQLSEEEAYALLRQTAMNEKRKLADIAQSIVTAASLLER
jgi:response regulator NasT